MTSAAQLIEQARQVTSLDDFGDDGFREGLEILIESAETEARLSEAGHAALMGQIIDYLSCRLQLEHWYTKHPEIDDEEIVEPLIGLGLPRTGSTALACLLAEDPGVRSLRNWEAMAPCPPPGIGNEESDPRIAQAEEAMAQRDILFPRMKQMLPSTATSPTECQTLMAQDFKSQIFQAQVYIPTYNEWFNHKADLVPTYRYVKRILKMLQWRRPPNRWRLKNPTHSLFIGPLVEVFPDARFCMTHRDITQVIPSVADVYFELSQAYSEHVDKKVIAQVNIECWELAMRRMIAFRDAGNDDKFFDISFSPFMKDPFPIIEKLYIFLGEEFTDEARTCMQAWRRNTPRDKHGSHSFNVEDFGIDFDELRKRFQFYNERFGEATAAC